MEVFVERIRSYGEYEEVREMKKMKKKRRKKETVRNRWRKGGNTLDGKTMCSLGLTTKLLVV